MAFDGNPHRTLGLDPGASQAEIKAAYRRLAKAFHPDAAGEAAIPRFLAIQAAYEILTGTPARTTRRSGPRAEAWRADPEQARAARDAWSGRGAGPSRGAGTRPRPETGGGRGEGSSRAEPGGAAGGAAGRRSTRGPTGREGRSDAGPRSRPRRDRAPDRATPGSTTYDFADQEPFDPEWSGASWYGNTSGTYWTINPKEYADPRKHGPEYQARGRRRGWPEGAPPGGGPEESAEGPAPEKSADGPGAEPPGGPGPSGATSSRRPPEPHLPPRPRARPVATPGDYVGASMAGAPSAYGGSAARDLPLPAELPFRGRSGVRLLLALIGWPPLGFAVGALIGEASGCSRFAAGCSESVGIAAWLAQLAVIALLLAVPRLAAVSATGTLVALAVSVPATLLLSISGGSQERAAAILALTIVLAIAYVTGVAFAVLRGSRRLRT